MSRRSFGFGSNLSGLAVQEGVEQNEIKVSNDRTKVKGIDVMTDAAISALMYLKGKDDRRTLIETAWFVLAWRNRMNATVKLMGFVGAILTLYAILTMF